jgi:Carboxypeptidase regulatory-like domain
MNGSMAWRKTVLAAVLIALVLALPTAAGTSRSLAAPKSASPGLLKHVATGRFVVPPAPGGGNAHIGGIALDAAGNLYAAFDRLQTPYIAVFDSKGTFVRSWQAGNGTGGIYRIPLTLGPDGLIYTIEGSVNTVEVFTTAGALVRQFAIGSVSIPSDIEVDQSGNVYVTSNDAVTRTSPSGAVTGQWQPLPNGGAPGGGSPPKFRGIAVQPDGSMWVTTADQKDWLFHLDANGKRLKTWDPALVIPGMGADQFWDVDYADGKLYFGGSMSGANHAHFANALAVVTPEGRLLDEVVGSASYVAVGAGRVALVGRLSSSAGAASTFVDDSGWSDTEEIPAQLPPGHPAEAWGICDGSVNPFDGQKGEFYGLTSDVVVPGGGRDCQVTYVNYETPCVKPQKVTFATPYLGGRPSGTASNPGGGLYVFNFSKEDLKEGSGTVLIRYDCLDPVTGAGSTHWEYKGDVYLLDPSGTVVDRRNSRPIAGATVRLQVSPVPGQPYGSPGASSYSPQLNPQETGPSGTFAWDVAPGRWRLRVTAFGYRPYVSKTYKVPPAVTNLRLALTPDPRTQRVLIDPAGSVGSVRLHAKVGRRVAGLRVVAVRHHVRSIAVTSKRFRTAFAIRLGSSEFSLQRAYPQLLEAAKKLAKKATRPYRVRHVTFTVRRGRVVAIKLS